MAEIMQLLEGLSRQRVYQLLQVPDFPEPFDELVMGNVYLRTEVEDWGRAHGYPIEEITVTSKRKGPKAVSPGEELPRPRARRKV